MARRPYQKRTCRRCPCFAHGWCGVFAKRVSAEAKACAYGIKKIFAAYMRDYMAKFRE